MRGLLFTFLLLVSIGIFAQMPGGRTQGGGRNQNLNMGHLYGKVVDSKTGKGIDGASLQLLRSRFNSATGKMIASTIKATITNSKGDFDLDNLPVMGNTTLKFSAIGYQSIEQKVSFGMKGPQGEGNREQMLSMIDKDLGNIKLQQDAANLGNVTVTSTKALFEMGVTERSLMLTKTLQARGRQLQRL